MAVWRSLAVYWAILAALVALSAQRLTALSLPALPRALWGPFLRPLASAAFEMALLVAVPAALLAGRASGLSQRSALLLLAALTSLSVSAAISLDPGSIAPGSIAQQLIDSGREACPSTPERRVEVPLVGLTWLCPPDRRLRASGRLPAGPKLSYSAASLQVSPDLRSLELTELELDLPAAREWPRVRASVSRASVRGLPPWGRPAGRSVAGRILNSVLACLATAAAALFILPRLRVGWLLAALMGALAGFCPLLVNRALDRLLLGSLSYWLVILAGPLAVGGLSLLLLAIRRILRRRSSVARGPG